VKSGIQRQLRAGRARARLSTFGARAEVCRSPGVRRQPMPARVRSKALAADQSLDPMQAAVHALCRQVMPHAPHAARSCATEKVGADLNRGHLIGSPALAGRLLQSGQSMPREAPSASHIRSVAIFPGLRDEGERRVDFFGKSVAAFLRCHARL